MHAGRIVWDWRGERRAREAAAATRSVRLRGVIAGAVGLVAGTLLFLFWSRILGIVALSIGGVTALSALVSPNGIHRQLNRAVGLMAFLVGTILTWLILVPVFYLVFFPFGLIARRGSRDPLERRRDPAAKTYWRTRTETPAERYERLY
jgi:hypothetical protein